MSFLFNTLIRFGFMIMVATVMGFFLMASYNYLAEWFFWRHDLDYPHAFIVMFLVGIFRFQWDFEKLV